MNGKQETVFGTLKEFFAIAKPVLSIDERLAKLEDAQKARSSMFRWAVFTTALLVALFHMSS
jgi:hypothetical protein